MKNKDDLQKNDLNNNDKNDNINNENNPEEIERNKQLKVRNEEFKKLNLNLSTKYNQLKENVLELKKHIDTAVFSQIDNKNQKIIEIKNQINDANNKQNTLLKDLDDMDLIITKQKQVRQKYFSLLNDKMKNENFYLNQEDIIKELKTKNQENHSKIEKLNENLQKINDNYSNLYKDYEDKRNNIKSLQNELNNKIIFSKNNISLLNEKTQEIQNLRNLLESLKEENEQKQITIQNLKNKLKLIQDKNKHITSFLQDNSINNNNVSNNVNYQLQNSASSELLIGKHPDENSHQPNPEDISLSNSNEINQISHLNENEENNMKEIAGLMQDILKE